MENLLYVGIGCDIMADIKIFDMKSEGGEMRKRKKVVLAISKMEWDSITTLIEDQMAHIQSKLGTYEGGYKCHLKNSPYYKEQQMKEAQVRALVSKNYRITQLLDIFRVERYNETHKQWERISSNGYHMKFDTLEEAREMRDSRIQREMREHFEEVVVE
jgi:hypothetical protein